MLTVAGGSFRYAGAPAGVEALGFTARFAPDSLAIGDLAAKIGGQPVAATLVATRFADPWVRFSARGDVDLAAVGPMVAPRDTKLGGRVAVNVAGSGRAKDPGSLALDGGAILKGVSVRSPMLPKPVEDVHGDVRFSQTRASVTGFGARAGKSSFALDATVTRPLALFGPPAPSAGAAPAAGAAIAAPVAPGAGASTSIPPATMDFTLTSPYLDLGEIMPTTAGGAPVLPNAVGGGRVAIRRLIDQKLDVQDVAATVTLAPRVMTVTQYAMRAYGGRAAGTAKFDLRDPAKPAFDVQSKVDSLEADAILSAWTPAKNLLHGALSTNLQLSGSGASPADLKRTITAVGLALVADGTFGPGPTLEALARYVHVPALKTVKFKDAKVPFRVEHGAVVTDPVVLSGPYGDWRLIGSIGFDGALDYAVSATLPKEVASALGANAALAAGALSDDQGRILLDLRVRGPAAAPSVSWDTGAMRDRIAGRVSQAIAGQRSRLDSTARAFADTRTRAAADSARNVIEQAKRAAGDSLAHRVGDVFKGFFSGGRDTTKH
ncbi:MAG: hypothetical protein HY076_00775 [Candidatus Eisenbacteria bacterium]|uniref:AsmA-like C-terminal domain-containing protein n=1 Tax=Eiseniibacteriota bacterium TaxID=2212470 RepID=A0A9D6QNA7_UNCEI|nr:hypothetical protein [Candidatus Eisenbacteria bacterium]